MNIFVFFVTDIDFTPGKLQNSAVAINNEY